jgi:cytochrome P450
MANIRTPETWESLFDPFDDELVVSPYFQYDRLRSQDPVHWSPPLRAWVLTRLEDIDAVLKDENFVAVQVSKSVAELARRTGRNFDPLVAVLDATLFFMNGDRHRQDRRTISKIMNRQSLTELKPAIQRFASLLASKLSGVSEFDVIKDFADPLPQYVMAHILGLPLSDVVVLSDLLAELTLVFDPITIEVCDQVNDKAAAAIELLKLRIIEASEANVENGLSIIYHGTAGAENDRLADAAATALFSFRVGAETTTGLIGLLIRTLIQEPSLQQRARENPSLRPTIVSEVLRLESNVQRVVRIALKTQSIGSKEVRAGERLLLLLGAANRDPAAFFEPESLCMNARENPDLVFGAGSHFCLGASLARLEGEIALGEFLRLPRTVQAGAEKWYNGRSIRRLTQLPVRVIDDVVKGSV